MLKQRVITGVILGVLIVLGVLYLTPMAFDLLTLLIAAIAAWEFLAIFKWDYQKRSIFLIAFLLTSIPVQILPAIPTLMIGALWWLASPYFLWRHTEDKQFHFDNLNYQALLGFVTFIPSWLGIVVIRGKFGVEFLLYLLIIIAAVDIGSYFSGKLWGKRLLAPDISPKKTVEGLIGGVSLATFIGIVGVFLLKFKFLNLDYVQFNFTGLRTVSFIMLSIISCLWSVIGDLFESMLKRQAGVKDSGKILPGHGGMYDRIDSLTAAIPIFALGLLLI